jgi:outer membrane protein assembly factor BamA
VPYQDYYALLTMPHLLDDRMRLEIRPSFTYETTQRYYGIGNQSRDTSPAGPDDPSDPFYEYGRTHPTLVVRARLKVAEHCFVRVGNSYTQDWLDVKERSQLAVDRAGTNPYVRKLLADTAPHAVDFFEYGLEYDRRDDEIETTRGTWDIVKVRFSPGGADDLRHRYAQLDATVRGYVPLGRRIVVATRAVFDLQTGDPPFYELARYDDTFALGGSMGVRGVPGQRYYGEVKLFGNAELRAFFWDFRMLKKQFALGGVAFVDAGRVWAEAFHAHPELDGTTLGLKLGIGGGLRLRQGEAFVVRGDVAWSPDARPIGGYFAAGELF